MRFALLLAATAAAAASATTLLDKIAYPVAHAIDMDNDGDTDVLTVSTPWLSRPQRPPSDLTRAPQVNAAGELVYLENAAGDGTAWTPRAVARVAATKPHDDGKNRRHQ